MKKLLIILVLLVPFVAMNAQDTKSRKEKKEKKEMQTKKEVEKIIDNQSFVFNASHAMPMSGSSVSLNYYFNVKIDGDSIQSYLPYYGVAYTAEYGSSNSPLDFEKEVKNIDIEKDKKGYLINFDVKNGNDYLKYSFRVSELGFASLNVTSTNRQSISYTGKIEPIEQDG